MNETHLDRHRAVQQLAYECVEKVAAQLQPGMTEREVTRQLRRWLLAHGVDDWFHLPFAWFGDRTAFRNFRTSLQFFPTNRRLEAGMPFILDVAPVVAGATADIGYSGALGGNDTVDAILDDLLAHRDAILEGVRAGQTMREVYKSVDHLAAEQGYDNRHRRYPYGVIAHRVETLPARPGHGIVAGFGVRSLRALARSAVVGRQRGTPPLWADGRRHDRRPLPGLWAVEPHLGRGDVGAKFEELLVVTPEPRDSYWLDNDLPHVRRHVRRPTEERVR